MSATLTKVKYAKLLGGGVKMFKLSKAKSGKAATPMAVSFVPNTEHFNKYKAPPRPIQSHWVPAFPLLALDNLNIFSFVTRMISDTMPDFSKQFDTR